jgi:hypothetical protein
VTPSVDRLPKVEQEHGVPRRDLSLELGSFDGWAARHNATSAFFRRLAGSSLINYSALKLRRKSPTNGLRRIAIWRLTLYYREVQ